MNNDPTNTNPKSNWLDFFSRVSRSSPGPMYSKIHGHVKEAIESGLIKPGTRLPTNRQLSEMLEVDRSTAARAYQELVNEGYLESFVGRGSFARLPEESSGQASQSIVWNERFSKASQTVFDMFRSESSSYDWKPGIISFAGGIPTEDSYPTGKFEEIIYELLESNRSREFFNYSPAEGHPLLRQQVVSYLSSNNLDVTEEELLIVSGSQQAIDVVSTVMIDPGDVVVTEEPTYLWATCCFKSRQARCLSVPLDDQGIRLDMLESILKRHRPKLIYTIPDFQNPTGITMSLERRQDLLELAAQHQVPILEDNFVGELRYEGEKLPSLRSLPQGDSLVIHQGTFSKALCPALRLGWLVAPAEAITRMLIAKRASNLSTNSISQVILAEFLRQGLYEKHLQSVREKYRARRDEMLTGLKKELGYVVTESGIRANIEWSMPDGGMFVWVKLPDGLSASDLLSYAQREGVTFAPGDLCFNDASNTEYLRLCFIQHDVPAINKGIKRLARAIRDFANDSLSTASQLAAPGSGTGMRTFI